jgi:hypothetical protein
VTWTRTTSGHEVGLVDGKIRCRNKAGKTLRTVPSALKDDPTVVGLKQLLDWLARHEATCQAEVERWMVRSLPMPLPVLVQLWPDPAWQRSLKDLVVRPADEPDAEVGLLRAVDAEQGAGLVTLDGDTVWVDAAALSAPHPVLLPDLVELRGFVVDLGVEQVVPQLFREIYPRPDDVDLRATQVSDWSGGRFAQLRHLTGRATSQGYAVRGGFAAQKIFEAGRTVEARFWVGSDSPDAEAETGELGWIDDQSRPLPLAEVGPVAWSEGARMAARIHAGRTVNEEQNQ